MKILAMDTSAAPVSAALLDNGKLVAEYFINQKITHSQTLMPIVESLLATSMTDLKDIDVFAVDAGPGSFTGVRIGTAFVKGLAMPLDRPCASVSTLEAMAYNMPYDSGIICAVMDARCNQVYNALFEIVEGEIVRLKDDRALSIDELKQELISEYADNPIYIVGDGAELFSSACEDCNFVLVPQNIRYQRAYGTAKVAERLATEEQLCTAAALQPLYLRLPQAERERNAKLAQQKENS